MAPPSNADSTSTSPSEKYPCPTEVNVLDFVSKLSSDRNYDKWRRLMSNFIDSQDLIGFIKGTAVAKEIKGDGYTAWKRSDNLVRGWILATLSEDTRLQVMEKDPLSEDTRRQVMEKKSAVHLWTELEKIFGASTDRSSRKNNDIALRLLQKKPKLACREWPDNLLAIIAEKPSSFKSGNSSKFRAFWQTLIYWGAPEKSEGIVNHHNEGETGDIENPAATNCCISVMQILNIKIWEVAKLVPYVKRIQEDKEKHYHARELVKFLCMEVAKLKLSEVEMIFKPALRKAACLGIPEIIEEIVWSYPSALFFVPKNQNIITYAIQNRREHVFNLVHRTGWKYIYGIDSSSNNVLHLAARLGHEQQINLNASAAGAVLQMQREMRWYKAVEELTPPGDRESTNIDGMTPADVFSETHQDLVKEAERWIKETAASCTVVAILIATIVFAAAITVPGGNNDDGHPLLWKQNAFIVFAIFDGLALFSSITSVLMFLLILNSRCAEEDFLKILPERLIIGFITLFVSILSTMIAFGAILYLVFGNNKAWVLISIVASAGIPVILFGAFQFLLLAEMIHSTYGGGIFGKQRGHRPLR